MVETYEKRCNLVVGPFGKGVGGYGGGGGMRRKRHQTLSKIINRLSANALSGMGSRTAWSISSVY
jgi:hypothetical protein